MKYKTSIFLFIFLISISLCFAFTNHFNWGNGEYNAENCAGYLFSSCYPQNDTSLNFTQMTISESADRIPIVFYNLLDNNDPTFSNRYLYITYGNSILMYNTADVSYYATYLNPIFTSNKIICQPFILRDDDYSGYDIVTLENTTLGYKITSSIMTNTKTFAGLTFLSVPNTSISCAMNYPNSDNYMAVLLSNGSVNIYSVNETINFKSSFYIGIPIDSNIKYNYPYYSNPITMADMNDDGHDDVLFAIPRYSSDGSYMYTYLEYGIYDVYNSAFILPKTTQLMAQIQITSAPNYANLKIFNSHVSAVKTGTSTSSYKIYAYGWFNYTATLPSPNPVYNISYNYVISQSGSILFDPNSFTAGANHEASNMIFTDYNYDGYSESCLTHTTGVFNCYNSAFNLLLSSTGYGVKNLISMGKLSNNKYMSVLSIDGIYDFNETDNWNVYNFSYNKFKYQIPVSLLVKNQYSNDIFTIYSSFIDEYLLQQNVLICGDNVCSPFENPITCPEDCFKPDNVTSNVTLKVQGEHCVSDNECSSGLCDINKCALKLGGDTCTVNSECLSGSCSHSLCIDSGTSANFKQIINNLFGFSSDDGVIFYLLIAGIIFIISIGASIILMHYMPAIAGIALDIMILVGFTFIGITPGWLLLMIFIILAFISFILFMIFSRQQ